MKLKSITKTDDYKYVEFGQIKDFEGAAIHGPDGFYEVHAFEKIKTGPTKILMLSNGMQLQCDPCHRVMTNNGEKFVKDLSETDRLIGNGPCLIDFEMIDGPEADLYDIEIDTPHWYYTSGIVSHNSIMLVNNAMANVLAGRNVLYITLELSDVLSALRGLGVLTNKSINKRRFDARAEMLAIVKKVRASGVGDLAFHEFPPDEISVDEIYALIDHLKRSKGWVPDVICVDYLELMRSRRATDNREEYAKQKAVATQVRGLANNENALVFTATQTNRSGNTEGQIIDVTKIAESYGKSMPMDYLVSLNQSQEDYNQQYNNQHVSVHPAPAIMYIAKNRNGPKFQSVPIEINYNTMSIKETL
jgi:hypothetical protein